ncbi:MAG: heat-shock protein [Succinivibrionaceae bacterium]|nr:heat-shock protein [Succinivibrionaceae bacterium]
MAEDDGKVRLDKWMWAARFYRTRTIAREMIEGGKVDYNGARGKPARAVEVGARIRFLQGDSRREVEVLALSSSRGSATVAAALYRETEESVARREREQELRRNAAFAVPHPDSRPSKKERRELRGLKMRNLEG